MAEQAHHERESCSHYSKLLTLCRLRERESKNCKSVFLLAAFRKDVITLHFRE